LPPETIKTFRKAICCVAHSLKTAYPNFAEASLIASKKK